MHSVLQLLPTYPTPGPLVHCLLTHFNQFCSHLNQSFTESLPVGEIYQEIAPYIACYTLGPHRTIHFACWTSTLHCMLHVGTLLYTACWDPALHCMLHVGTPPYIACCTLHHMLRPHLTSHVACREPALHHMLHVRSPPYIACFMLDLHLTLHFACWDPTLHCMLHVGTPPYISCCMQGPTLYCRSLLTRSALSFSTRSLVVLAGDFLDASLAALTSPSSTSTCDMQHVHKRGGVFQQAKMSFTVKPR